MPLQAGQILNNRYRIEHLLGQGGFGAVYLAWDQNLDERMAIKESLEVSPVSEKQFRSEAKMLFTLRHPNLPIVHDCFAIPNQGLYLAMDYIEGESLAHKLAQAGGALPLAQALAAIVPICDALDYLHRRQPPIIHRDIKPANIIIRQDGVPFLVDFGISKLFDPDRKTTLGARALSPGYSPPEQYGQAATDARSDIYALGATLYHLLTGQVPPAAMDITAGVAKPALPPHSLNPTIPPALSAAVMRALLPDRTQRWNSAGEFKQALLAASSSAATLAADTLVQPPAPVDRPAADDTLRNRASSPPRRRSPIAWVLGGLAMLACIGFVLLAGWFVWPDPPAAPTAAAAVAPAQPAQPATATIRVTEITPPTAVTRPTQTARPAATKRPPTAMPALAGFKACQVTDTGGIDDKSFNATAWKGIQDAMARFGIEGKYLESQQQTDYEKNLNAFVEEGCDIIVPVGFLLGDAAKAAAEKNPEVPFTIVDVTYDPVIPNVLGQSFAVDQSGFLAGYLAAGVTKTGTVATFGGINIPPVTAFMDGFALGVKHYNQVKGADVQVLGWDVETQEGLFVGNFESTDDGRTMGESLMDEGADIIMPVAGPVGLGTAAAAKERGNVYIIGVDNDWFNTAPEYRDIILTSILKNMDVLTARAIEMVIDGSFKGGVLTGTLENGGMGLAPYHNLESMVSAELQAEVQQLSADIIAGTVVTHP